MLASAITIPESAIDKPPRSKRRMLVSLRLFVGMLILFGGGGVLWIGTRAYRQHVVIQEIEKVGGYVPLEPVGPQWLRVRVGEARMRAFDKALWIHLSNTSATDDTLRHVDSLVGLTGLRLDNTRVTDVTLARLASLTQLESLSLRGTDVTDAGLQHLSQLTRLRAINLSKTAVTDAGVAELSGLTRLESLFLHDTAITDAGLAELSGLTNLVNLSLQGTAITDEGLVELSGLTKLVSLSLHDTAITDEGLAELSDLSKLGDVTLGPEITDAGLQHIPQWPNLWRLWLVRTQVTAPGVRRLKAVLPRCAINY